MFSFLLLGLRKRHRRSGKGSQQILRRKENVQIKTGGELNLEWPKKLQKKFEHF